MFGHPIHQMLVVFPLGLLGTSLLFDILHFATGRETWALVSYYMIAAGLLSGLLAAIFGFIGWLGIPGATRAKRPPARRRERDRPAAVRGELAPAARRSRDSRRRGGLAAVGVALALVTGWLGGELVDRLGVGVDEGAHLNAPSSLSGQPAHQTASSRI